MNEREGHLQAKQTIMCSEQNQIYLSLTLCFRSLRVVLHSFYSHSWILVGSLLQKFSASQSEKYIILLK